MNVVAGISTIDTQVRPADAAVRTARIQSIDIVRGVIMVLMAIDHVRVYSGIPAGGPTPGVFFTRWITHFCAPGFVFFAGTAAYLHGRKLGDAGALSRYLLVRGLLLVLLELTLIRFTWTFNFVYSGFTLAGVIWMLGWCMVLLAALVRLPAPIVGLAGVAIIVLQQLFGLVPTLFPENARSALAPVWEFVYPSGVETPFGISVLYVLVPWIGVMMAGYGFGAIVTMDPAARKRLCLRIGLVCTALFVVLGSISAGLQGAQGSDGETMPFLLRLLNQQKYPASQLFLLMTLGPLIALLPFVEHTRNPIAGALATIGRVPLFYYLLHIPLIHISALITNMLRTGAAHGEWYTTAPFTWLPPEQHWGLGLLYSVFAINVIILYSACRWFAGVKAERPGSWLRYV
jgi:uncharacterized membrane protein